MITDHMVCSKKRIGEGGRVGGCPAMATMRLNSQVRQLGGFEHGKRVFGRPQKLPIGAVGNPHFWDFTNPKEAQTAETHHFLGVIRQIRQASPAAYFNGKLNLRLNRRSCRSGNGEFLPVPNCVFPWRQIGRRKGGNVGYDHGVIIGGFVNKSALVHFRV